MKNVVIALVGAVALLLALRVEGCRSTHKLSITVNLAPAPWPLGTNGGWTVKPR